LKTPKIPSLSWPGFVVQWHDKGFAGAIWLAVAVGDNGTMPLEVQRWVARWFTSGATATRCVRVVQRCRVLWMCASARPLVQCATSGVAIAGDARWPGWCGSVRNCVVGAGDARQPG